MRIEVEIFRPSHPGDASGVAAALRRLPHERIRRLAVFGKTEGPATLNDFSRDLAQAAVESAVRQQGGADLLARTWRLFSTGCEGIASPVTVLLAELEDHDSSRTVGLAMGAARSPALPAAERCGIGHLSAAAAAVREALATAGLTPDQARLILIKSPVLSPNEASRAPRILARHAGSTASSRGAAALGAGIALGQVDAREMGEDPVGVTCAYAERVMAFSGTETDQVEVIVLGECPGGDPRWSVASASLEDMLDNVPFASLREADGGTPMLVFLKAGIPPGGNLRGLRTTVLTSDLTPDKQIRAAASGVVGAHFGMTSAFISAGAEHQGPPGASVAAVLSKHSAPRTAR